MKNLTWNIRDRFIQVEVLAWNLEFSCGQKILVTT
jgi:hypothetical protein